ncbi:MAG: LamG-like jellyroll fold domain-containing protein [Patescibacteria group bacterium]
MKMIKLVSSICFLLASLVCGLEVKAMPIGTLLYRTSNQGLMYGYNSPELIVSEKGVIKHIYSGHVGIYVGLENGVPYVVEALGDGVVKTPAQYFVNESAGEKFLGAKFPKQANSAQAQQAVAIAKKIAADNLAYDLDFRQQKGPGDGDWTCVGLVEKVYESANISNPDNLGALEYNQPYYAVDITPDGFDNTSLYNSGGDCFSRKREFSKISRQDDLLVPLPELIGFAAGLEYKNERYIFLPYTQFLQESLREVAVDIKISSSFPEEEIRGSVSVWPVVLKWSLINNPISSLKKVVRLIFPKTDDLDDIPLDKAVPTLLNPLSVINEDETDKDGEDESLIEKVVPEDLLEIIPPVVKEKAEKILASSTTLSTSPKKTAVKASSSPAVKPKTASSSPPVQNQAAPSPPKVKAAAETKIIAPISTSTNTSTQAYVRPVNTYVATTSPAASSSTSTLDNLDPASILAPGHIVISRVGEAGEDDWVELFNPFPVAFDLAANDYRLERSKTAVDPSIILRFNDPEDGVFKTTVIAPYGRYLITRAEASPALRNQAQAISLRDEFSWPLGGYTLYLAKDAVSSNLDPDIIDYLGFGEAAYYEGSAPAPAFTANYYLSRKALASSTPVTMLEGGEHYSLNLVYDSNNNSFDWILLPISGSLELASSSEPYDDTDYGLDSPGIVYLNHFDECYQPGQKFIVGLFACARIFDFKETIESADFSPSLGNGNFSLSFFYKPQGVFPRFFFRLSNGNGNENLEISLESGMSEIAGLPGIAWRNYDHNFWPDEDWHLFTLVSNSADGYWAIYQDGEEIYRRDVSGSLPSFNHLEFGGTNGFLAVDEFSVWNRALGAGEISLISQARLPFYPSPPLSPYVPAVLTNFYSFDENLGDTAHDAVGTNHLSLAHNFWYSNGKVGGYIFQDQRQTLITSPLADITGSDLSLTFWWRNRSHPNEGRVKLALNHDDKAMFGIVAGYYRPAYIFNGEYGIISEGEDKTIPYDDNWHHLALTYSARDYALNFYVDGRLKFSRPYIWIAPGEEINKLEIVLENYEVDLDELGVWRGTLSAEEVKNIFESE